VVIGAVATEDILPMWVAEAEDIFAEQDIDAAVQTFLSPEELSGAVVSGGVDLAMIDIIDAITLTASGTPVVMEWAANSGIAGPVLPPARASERPSSQNVMVVRADLAQTSEGIAVVERLAACWNEAVARINDDPARHQGLLEEKTPPPDPVLSGLVRKAPSVRSYPLASRPSRAMVDPVLDWMMEEGHLRSELTYDYETGGLKP
jgi:ABC-type nitrate/sulfonate/bicarbonate transport system substrate-binding protein